MRQGAQIDSFGVGERLITARSEPVFGGVYKLVGIEKDGIVIPKIKISENEEKITSPGFKKVYRIFDKATNKAIADLVTLKDEKINENKILEIFDPIYTWKKKKLKNYYIKELMIKIINKGKPIYTSPDVWEIRSKAKQETEKLWCEVLRLDNPHHYYIDLSNRLWKLKQNLLNQYSNIYEE